MVAIILIAIKNRIDRLLLDLVAIILIAIKNRIDRPAIELEVMDIEEVRSEQKPSVAH